MDQMQIFEEAMRAEINKLANTAVVKPDTQLADTKAPDQLGKLKPVPKPQIAQGNNFQQR